MKRSESRHDENRQGGSMVSRWLRMVAAPVMSLALAFSATALTASAQNVELEEDVDIEGDIDLEDIYAGDAIHPVHVLRTPHLYYGGEILVDGKIDAIHGTSVIELANEDDVWMAGIGPVSGEELLVVIPPALRAQVAASGLEENDSIIVYGEIRPALTAEIEDLAELGEDIDIDVDGEPVMIARIIEID